MTITSDTPTDRQSTDLAKQAKDAYAATRAAAALQATRRHREQVENIYRALAKLNITPADQTPAFVNAVSGQICVPLIAGELRIETTEDGFDYPVQTHAVAAEWDVDDRSVYLVADRDYDDPSFHDSGRWLYFAGYLHTLADLGEAIENGGRKSSPPTPSAAAKVAQTLQRGLTSEYLDDHDNAILAAAEAVCATLADIADAIRAGHRL